ncbi:MAG: hypothetical protein ACFCUQ_14765 [Kiloniellales bacterium]
MTAPLELRPPETVMRLERMGSFFQTRISFMRSLLRRIVREGWRLEREVMALDTEGYGHAIYAVTTPKGVVRLVAFSHALAPEERSDRVIAEKWDSTFALTIAEPTDATIERLRGNVPLQEAGRCSPSEYVLSRANKSVRLFDCVVDSLAAGCQPDPATVVEVGYLMRTTAVYGNGKYGLSDLAHTFGGGLFARPFEAELFTVYLIREFTFDLVEHLARVRAPATAVPLSAASKRRLGIGNATGLGMAPFLIGHPRLIHRWILARETAIARVRALERTEPARLARFRALLDRAIRHLGEWRTDDSRQMGRILTLRRELPDFAAWAAGQETALLQATAPWRRVLDEAGKRLSVEGQELINSLVLEPHGELVDDLEDGLAGDESLDLDPAMTVERLKGLIEARYAWALGIDYEAPEARHLFWYVSEEKLEPRLGERFSEPGADRELRLGIGREVKRLHDALASAAPETNVAKFLLQYPEQRQATRRVQGLAAFPYAEVQDNLLGKETIAVDLLRCKLSMFGAIKFDPKSDRWTRITMYQGAPSFEELEQDNADAMTADDWAFPVFLEVAEAGRRRSA